MIVAADLCCARRDPTEHVLLRRRPTASELLELRHTEPPTLTGRAAKEGTTSGGDTICIAARASTLLVRTTNVPPAWNCRCGTVVGDGYPCVGGHTTRPP